MKTNIQKWGNSLGVRIPAQLAQQLQLHPGSIVEISIENDHLNIYPQKYTLSSMLSQITDENKQGLDWEEDFSKGNESW